MNLNKLVRDKIKKLGATKAAAYFEVSVPTVYSWKKKNPPTSAVQKILDEDGWVPTKAPETQPAPQEEPPIETQPAPQEEPPIEEVTETPPMQPSDKPHPAIEQEVVYEPPTDLTVEQRLEKIEATLTKIIGGKPQLRSGIQPFQNPNSGITVNSKAEVIEGQPDRKPQAAFWNRPLNDGPRKPGWNEPVSKVSPRNPGGDWNKPVNQES